MYREMAERISDVQQEGGDGVRGTKQRLLLVLYSALRNGDIEPDDFLPLYMSVCDRIEDEDR